MTTTTTTQAITKLNEMIQSLYKDIEALDALPYTEEVGNLTVEHYKLIEKLKDQKQAIECPFSLADYYREGLAESVTESYRNGTYHFITAD